MKPEKAVNHGEHGDTAEKQELVLVYPITRWVSPKKRPKLKPFAVPAVFAVVKLRY